MDDRARNRLQELLAEHGRDIATDATALAEHLADAFGDSPGERHVLWSVATEGVVGEMLEWSQEDTALMLIDQWSARVVSDHGLKAAAARWGVRTWGLALGTFTERALAEYDQRRAAPDNAALTWRWRSWRTWVRLVVLISLAAALVAASARWFQPRNFAHPKRRIPHIAGPPQWQVGRTGTQAMGGDECACLAVSPDGTRAGAVGPPGWRISWSLGDGSSGAEDKDFCSSSGWQPVWCSFLADGDFVWATLLGGEPASRPAATRPARGAWLVDRLGSRGLAIAGPPSCAAVAPDGTRQVYLGFRSGGIGKLLSDPSSAVGMLPGRVTHLAVSRKAVLAAGQSPACVGLWKRSTPSAERSIRLPHGRVVALGFCEGRPRVVSCRKETAALYRVQVWAIAGSEETERPAGLNRSPTGGGAIPRAAPCGDSWKRNVVARTPPSRAGLHAFARCADSMRRRRVSASVGRSQVRFCAVLPSAIPDAQLALAPVSGGIPVASTGGMVSSPAAARGESAQRAEWCSPGREPGVLVASFQSGVPAGGGTTMAAGPARSGTPPAPRAPPRAAPALRLREIAQFRVRRPPAAQRGAVALGPGGRMLVYCDADGLVHLWDIEAGLERARWRSVRGKVAIVGGRRWQVLVAGRGFVRSWDVPAERVGWVVTMRGVADSLAFSEDGRRVIARDAEGRVSVWDVATGRKRMPISSDEDAPYYTRVTSPEDTRLYAAPDGSVRLWDGKANRERYRLEGHTGRVTSVAFSPDFTRALSGGADGTVRLWDLGETSGAPVGRLAGHDGDVVAVAWSPDGQWGASAGRDATVRLWRVGQPEPTTREGRP